MSDRYEVVSRGDSWRVRDNETDELLYYSYNKPTHRKQDAELAARNFNSGHYTRDIHKWVHDESVHISLVKDEAVEHPKHYNRNGIEVIDVIEAYELGFRLANTVKYVLRADTKHKSPLEDLKKARWYLDREIMWLEGS